MPGKNIVDLCGLPLIAYSIRSALACKAITRVVVSTDDETIAETALQYGAEVPALRSKEYSGDKARIDDVIRHTLDTLKDREGYVPDNTATLYPTSPFRHRGLLDELVDKLVQGYNPVSTYKRISIPEEAYFTLGADGRVKPYANGSGDTLRMPYYRSYGLFSGSRKNGRRNPFMYLIKNRANYMDIDTIEDLATAAAYLESNDFDFGW